MEFVQFWLNMGWFDFGPLNMGFVQFWSLTHAIGAIWYLKNGMAQHSISPLNPKNKNKNKEEEERVTKLFYFWNFMNQIQIFLNGIPK